jgi:hypothetical protein
VGDVLGPALQSLLSRVHHVGRAVYKKAMEMPVFPQK